MNTPTIEQLKEALHYAPDTGVFTRLKASTNSVRVGDIAGTLNKKLGYVELSVLGYRTYAHRLAWFYVHGEWPKEIDHINGDRADNRISNLRPATKKQNCENKGLHPRNTSGFRGVHQCPKTKMWVARITNHGRGKYLGHFKTPALAGEFAELARSMMFTHHRQETVL